MSGRVCLVLCICGSVDLIGDQSPRHENLGLVGRCQQRQYVVSPDHSGDDARLPQVIPAMSEPVGNTTV